MKFEYSEKNTDIYGLSAVLILIKVLSSIMNECRLPY